MRIRLMQSLADWKSNPKVRRVIDAAKKRSGFNAESYDCYDDFINEFRLDVAHYLHEQGHTVAWQCQQSRGAGCILQDCSDECEAAFDAAMNLCKYNLFNDCVGVGSGNGTKEK